MTCGTIATLERGGRQVTVEVLGHAPEPDLLLVGPLEQPDRAQGMQRAEPWKVNPRELKVPVRFEVADLGALEEGDAVGVDLRDGDGNRIQPDSGDRWAYRLPLESRVLVSAGRAPRHGLLEAEPA